ncbi:MAG: extracellular solute-binding protein [Clostridiales bacterium]|nr:extracellular solute-binding protein [Clostridiales bacterium]
MKKVAGKVLTAALALTFTLGAVGCDQLGGGSDGDVTYISVANFGGGVGREWLDNAIERFQNKVKDVSYEAGKTGVEFDITSATNVTYEDIKTSGDHLYFVQPSDSVRLKAQQGLFLDITDIVTEKIDGENVSIEDKIVEDYRYAFKASDGKYYSLPHYELYAAVSYDMDMFDKYGIYLADGTDGEKYNCSLIQQNVYFVGNTQAKKSCGNDGKYGTMDDGLPTTLFEFVALCDYMKENCGVTPFVVAGSHIDYTAHLLDALWAAMSGYESRASVYSFDGTVEAVKGFSNQGLFPGESSIKAPITETVDVTMKTGYDAVNQAGRYYAAAFLELAEKRGWVDKRSTQNSFTHKDAMRAFILNNDTKVGMHIEGTYWYNEAKSYDLFSEYQAVNATDKMKRIGWMHMPTSLNTPVTENNGREEIMVVNHTGYAVINGNLAAKPGQEGVIKACKDFLKFLYTEKELQEFTATTGVVKLAMNYKVEDATLGRLADYQQSVMSLRNNNRVVRQLAENDLIVNNKTAFTWSPAYGWRPKVDAVYDYDNFIVAYREGGLTAQECFELTGYTAEGWASRFSKYFAN